MSFLNARVGGSKKPKPCNHRSKKPFGGIRCDRDSGHPGQHSNSSKGLKWNADGEIAFGGKSAKGKK